MRRDDVAIAFAGEVPFAGGMPVPVGRLGEEHPSLWEPRSRAIRDGEETKGLSPPSSRLDALGTKDLIRDQPEGDRAAVGRGVPR
jgi:hypothetical protein